MRTREIIPLKGELDLRLALPGSKSITNRAFLCAALAEGKSKIYGALYSDDTQAMLGALAKLGIGVKQTKTCIEITGGTKRLKKGKVSVDAGASGTTTRFLTAFAVLREGSTVIGGTKRMKERPIKDLQDALIQIGEGKQVIKVKCDKSSQFLSALLMVAPLLPGPLEFRVQGELVSKPYIDTTLAVMKSFGVKVKTDTYKSFKVRPQAYKACRYEVEGDASAASYFSALNFLHGGKLVFENLNYKKSIQGDINFPEALKQLKKRSPRTIDMDAMPDVALTLACVAPFVKGATKITGLSTLKMKETDRLAALETELKKLGVKAKKTKDSLTVYSGLSDKQSTISTYDDHRMAMSFAILGTKRSGVIIDDPGCTAKTYPEFWEDLEMAYLRPLKLEKKHLVLTGMRATGKTTYGKKIARKLGRKFVDLDHEIEKEEGISIEKMVKKQGWEHFRKIEQKMCSKIYNKYQQPLVLATGGGVVLSPKNMKNLKKGAVNVFIYADPQRVAARLATNSGKRPSLTGKKLQDEIDHIWNERRELYLKYADVVWDDTSGKALQKLKNSLKS